MKSDLIRLEVKRTMSALEINALREKIRFELAAKTVDRIELIRLHTEIAAQRTIKKMVDRKIQKLEQRQEK